MKNPPFIIELKKKLPAKEWAWTLAALRQDPGIWSALTHGGLGQQALAALPASGLAWSPAALALLSVSASVEAALDLERLRRPPLEPLPVELSSHIDDALRRISLPSDELEPGEVENTAERLPSELLLSGRNGESKPSNPSELAPAAWEALGLRERYRQNSSWRAIFTHMDLEQASNATALACLAGMLPEPAKLLRHLAKHGNARPRPDLALHVLLCQPAPLDVQQEQIKLLLSELDPGYGLWLLRGLKRWRPNLSIRLAQAFLADQANGWRQAPPADADLSEQFDHLAASLRLAEAHQLADDPDRAVPLMAETMREVRRLRGHLSAGLAQVVSQARGDDEHWRETARETTLEAWKQALQLTPDAPTYAAGMIQALIDSGRLADARSYLDVRRADGEDHPALSLAAAALADRLNEPVEAARCAQQALRLVEAGETLSLEAFISLAHLLQKLSLKSDAIRAARLGLAAYPLDPQLLAFSAQAGFQLGQAEEALIDAHTAMAAAELDEGEPDRPALQALVIDSLEAVGAWNEALEERTRSLAVIDQPSADELHALIRCAEHAGRPERLREACLQALTLTPDDLPANRCLAEACQVMGQWDEAARYYRSAVQLAPDEPSLWSGLVQSLRKSGQEAQAVEALKQANQAAPDVAEFHLLLGETYAAQGSVTQALSSFRRAVALENSERTLLQLGQILLQLGHLAEARQVLASAYQMAQDGRGGATPPVELCQAYARALLGSNEYAAAVPLLIEVARQRPDDAQVSLDLSRALLQSGEPDGARRAVPFLQRILGLGPDGRESGYRAIPDTEPDMRAEARLLLAEAYAGAGEYAKAMEAYRQALDEPANRETRRQAQLSTGLGLMALKLNQPEMAVAALQEAAQTEPMNPIVQRSLSEAYLANGLALDAFQTARQVVDLMPNDADTLQWFAGHAERVAKQPGISAALVREPLVQALNRLVQLVPQRGDLLLWLGNLRLTVGDPHGALDVYRRLSENEVALQGASVDGLQQAAQRARELGEPRLAIRLLQAALAQTVEAESRGGEGTGGFESRPDSRPDNNPDRRASLYADLSLAYEQADEPEAALKSLDDALRCSGGSGTGGFDSRPDTSPDLAALHLRKADLLVKLDRLDQALDSLQEAARRTPKDPALRGKIADALRRKGELPAALTQAEQGLSVLAKDSPMFGPLHRTAAELSYATLRPAKAEAHLKAAEAAGSITQNGDQAVAYEHFALKAEIALDLGDEATAAEAVSAMLRINADNPRSQANAARLACRRGDPDERDRRCRAGVRAIVRMQLNQTPETPPSTREAYVAVFLAVAQAALESRMWEDALIQLNRLIEIIPETPLAYFKLAQVLTARAEIQCLCHDLDVVQHAPGAATMSEDIRQQIEANLSQAQSLLAVGELKVTDETRPYEDECRGTVGLWQARARALFQPSAATAAALEMMVRAGSPDGSGLAAVVMAYRRAGMPAEALQASQVGWPGTFGKDEPGAHAAVLAQAALAQPNIKQAALEAGRALDQRSAAADDWPAMPMLHYLKARLCLQAGDRENASLAIGKALAAWPDEPRWQELAGRLYLYQEAGFHDPVKALLHLEQAAAIDPEQAENHLLIGKIYLDGEQYERAVQSLETAARLSPDSADAWLSLARAQVGAGMLEPAAASAEKAVTLDPSGVEGLLLRGRLALQTGNPRGALNRAQAVLKTDPDHTDALRLIAKALDALDRPADALKALERVRPSNGSAVEMQLERIHLVKRSKGLSAAIPEMQMLVEAHPERPELLGQQALWLQETGQGEAAIQAAQKALQIGREAMPGEQCSQLHALIGSAMRQAGQLDQAIAHLNDACELDSTNLELLLDLGKAYQERREYKQALKTYQKAMSVGKDDYRPFFLAGQVLKDNKDYMASEAMLRRAAQIAPNEVSIHRLLGAVAVLVMVHSNKNPGD